MVVCFFYEMHASRVMFFVTPFFFILSGATIGNRSSVSCLLKVLDPGSCTHQIATHRDQWGQMPYRNHKRGTLLSCWRVTNLTVYVRGDLRFGGSRQVFTSLLPLKELLVRGHIFSESREPGEYFSMTGVRFVRPVCGSQTSLGEA